MRTNYHYVLSCWLIAECNKQLEANRKRWLDWANKNRDRIRAVGLAWRERNREHVNASSRKWASANLPKRRAVNQAWRENNEEERKRIAREYMKRRYEDPTFRLRHLSRNRIHRALAYGKGAKSARTHELIGCSVEQLRAHLEAKFQPGMSWENYGPVWHVDHVRPCASFDLSDPVQQRACFHFSNLQPLFAEDNIRKHCRILASDV